MNLRFEMRIALRQQICADENAEQLSLPAGIAGPDRQDASRKALELSPTVSRKGVGKREKPEAVPVPALREG